MLKRIIVSAVITILPLTAFADWSGKGEAGVVLARGNTTSDTANAKIEMVLKKSQWKYLFGASGIYASDNVGATAQRWDAHAQANYDFSARNFWFGAARYEDDRFSGFYYQAALTTGIGHKFIDTNLTKLAGQLGVGYKVFESRPTLADDNLTVVTPADRDSQALLSGNVDYSQAITPNTTLVDKLTLEAGAQNTFAENAFSVQVKMTQVLALALGYTVRHNTDPPTGFKRTDTLTTVNLVFELK